MERGIADRSAWLQGLGAAVITPAALSILMTTSRRARSGTGLGAWGGVGAFGAVAGVLLGGVLTRPAQLGVDLLHQRADRPRRPRADAAAARARAATSASGFDVPGAVLVTAGLVALVFGITQASDYGWASGETIGIFLAAAALLVGFLVWEMRAAEPLMPLWIFRIRTVAGANVAGLTLGTAVFAMFLMLTLYMQQVLRTHR